MEIITISKEELFSEIRLLLSEMLEKNTVKKVDDQELLTKKEVASHFTIHLSTVNRWISENKLKVYYLGGRVYLKKSELPLQ